MPIASKVSAMTKTYVDESHTTLHLSVNKPQKSVLTKCLQPQWTTLSQLHFWPRWQYTMTNLGRISLCSRTMTNMPLTFLYASLAVGDLVMLVYKLGLSLCVRFQILRHNLKQGATNEKWTTLLCHCTDHCTSFWFMHQIAWKVINYRPAFAFVKRSHTVALTSPYLKYFNESPSLPFKMTLWKLPQTATPDTRAKLPYIDFFLLWRRTAGCSTLLRGQIPRWQGRSTKEWMKLCLAWVGRAIMDVSLDCTSTILTNNAPLCTYRVWPDSKLYAYNTPYYRYN